MVLDRITSVNISDIVSEGSKVKIKVDVKDDKIVFPTQEEDIINLLILINQDIYEPYQDLRNRFKILPIRGIKGLKTPQ